MRRTKPTPPLSSERRSIRQRVALRVLLLLGACPPPAILNALAPRGGIAVQRDIAYGDGPRRLLDVYAPTEAMDGARSGAPVVVFFYGGGWDTGERAMYRFVGAALAARGAVAVIPDYRLFPEVRFPQFMDDAAQATAWAQRHAGTFGGDGRRVFLMGHSAGAQIAALLALDRRYLPAVGGDARELAGVIGLAGPYDFLPLRTEKLKAVFGPEQEWPKSQPINYVSAQAPPMLLATGDDDDTVRPGNTTRLAARLRAAGRPVSEIVYSGIGHRGIIAAMSGVLSFLAPVGDDIERFLKATNGPLG